MHTALILPPFSNRIYQLRSAAAAMLPRKQVRCGGELFEMHAIVVTCGSEYFRGMLGHAMAERASGAFELHEVRPRVLERVVQWLYSGELGEISDVGEGLALLEGSRFLRVERLEAQCCAWLCAHVDASNCVAVWAEANRLGCGVVEQRAMGLVGRKLASVAKEAQFLGLPREALVELVRSDELAVWSEETVYEAVMGWVRHDLPSRKAALDEVLSAVRMALLPPFYLAQSVASDPLVLESCEALLIVAEASQHAASHCEDVTFESSGLARKRKSYWCGVLVVVGGFDEDAHSLSSAEWYDETTELWRALPDMSEERNGCAAVCLDGDVYVMGGESAGNFLNSAEWYDGSTGRWRALPDMSAARNSCAAACVDGKVYVVGGDAENGGRVLQSAEWYDRSTGQWRNLPEMNVPRYGCAAVCTEEGHVYVMGGHDGHLAQRSAEMYDPSVGEWYTLPDMSVPRNGCAAVCLNGTVCVMGGHDGRSPLRSVEWYDASALRWRPLPDMRYPRNACAAACLGGHACVLGGGVMGSSHSSVEWFDSDHAVFNDPDPAVYKWHMLPSMSVAKTGLAAVVIDMRLTQSE